jgi:hypothetical protein
VALEAIINASLIGVIAKLGQPATRTTMPPAAWRCTQTDSSARRAKVGIPAWSLARIFHQGWAMRI